MKRTGSLLTLAALAAAAGVAHADVSSTITATSDYDFRGITQTAKDPALQISLDWSGESGAYLGAWASNVDFGSGTKADAEIDVLGGFRGSFNDDTTYDIGAVYYAYTPSGDDVEFGEVYAGIGYKAVSAKLWYAWDFGNSGESETYLEVNGTVPLPQDFGLTLHAGYTDSKYFSADGDNYVDYSIGLTKSLGNFGLTLKWIDGSDLKSSDGTPGDVFSSESRVVFSVATTLPWKD
jgi:uncharacterized protein (TIGR02001 family)